MVSQRPLAAIGRAVVKRISSKRKAHEKHFIKLYQVLCKHPNAWKSGVPLKKPMTGMPAKAPQGMTKEGAGIFGWIKKGYHAVQKLFHSHKKKIIDHVKREGTKLAGKALGKAKDFAVSRGKQILERGKAKVEEHARGYIRKAEAHVKKAADKVDSLIQKHLPEQKTAAGIIVRIRKTLGQTQRQRAIGATARVAAKIISSKR